MTKGRLFLLILLIFFKYSTNNELMLPSPIEHVTEISVFVRNAAFNYCYECYFTAIVSDKEVVPHFIKDRLLDICHKIFKPVILTNNVTSFVKFTQMEVANKHQVGSTPLLVIFVGDVDRKKFRELIADIHKLVYFRSTTRVLFVFYMPINTSDTTWLEDLFKIVWQSWILRAVAVFWSSLSTEIEVVSFNPFYNNYYVNMTKYASYRNIFYDKTIDMRGYPLRIMVQSDINRRASISENYKDMDVMTLLTAIQHVGASAIVNSSSQWPPRINKDLKIDAIDIFFISSGVVSDNYIESLYPHEQDDICVLVPRGEAIPQVLYLFMVFNIPVWFCFLLCVTLGITGHYFLNKRLKSTNLDVTVMNIIRVILAGPWVHLPKSNAARLLVNFWTLFGLLISSFFICGLTSALIERKYYPDVTTLRKLENTEWQIYGSQKDVSLVHDKLNETLSPEFLSRFQVLNETHINETLEGTMKKMRRHLMYKAMTIARKPILMNKEGALNFLESKESMVDGRRAFSLMHECPVPYQVAYSVTKGRGSVYAAMMDSIVQRLYVSGIIIHWKKMSEIGNNGGIDEEEEEEDISTRLLTLFHLQTPFYILALGMILGFLVFLVEVALGTTKTIIKRRDKKRLRKLNKRKLRNVYYVQNINTLKRKRRR